MESTILFTSAYGVTDN